jgi:hypothetical protein
VVTRGDIRTFCLPEPVDLVTCEVVTCEYDAFSAIRGRHYMPTIRRFWMGVRLLLPWDYFSVVRHSPSGEFFTT